MKIFNDAVFLQQKNGEFSGDLSGFTSYPTLVKEAIDAYEEKLRIAVEFIESRSAPSNKACEATKVLKKIKAK